MSTSSGRRPWGTYVLYVVTALGLVYLFIPLFTIARFTFNKPERRTPEAAPVGE